MYRSAILFIVLVFLPFCVSSQESHSKKILHLANYNNAVDIATSQQLRGFTHALGNTHCEYKTVEARDKSYAHATREMTAIIDTWHPDLIYATGNDALDLATYNKAHLTIPIIFSGVDQEHRKSHSHNITGIYMKEHVVDTLSLLKQIAPDVRKIGIILDNTEKTKKTEQQVRSLASSELPSVDIVSWKKPSTFSQYKHAVKKLQNSVDAIGIIGIFNFTDERGGTTPYQEVLEWTAKHCTVPDFSFWEDRIAYGTLCAVSIDQYEHGYAAGAMARKILIDNIPPSRISFIERPEGNSLINIARANALGLKLNTQILQTTEVVSKFEWDY